MPLTNAMKADLGLGADVPTPQPDRLVTLAEQLVNAAARVEDSSLLAAAQREQVLQSLNTIKANTEPREWDFPVTRDADGRILSVRAIPQRSV